MSPLHEMLNAGPRAESSKWQFAAGYRYLHSDRHFVGSDEQEHRGEEGSQVINDSHFIDLALTYAITNRLSLMFTIPYATHDRSSVVRDANRTILHRYHTQNEGLGDLRITGNSWLFDPNAHVRGNVLLGIGVDAPTGRDDAEDYFDTYDVKSKSVVKTLRTVDQSIQLGDGGWGAVVDVFAYRRLSDTLTASFSGQYTITPEETNGVATNRSNPYEQIMGIADSYSARLGLDYSVWSIPNLTFTLAARAEGVPVHDLVGGNDGFRRPGYTVSIEPGVRAVIGSYALSLNTSLAVYRNRERSVADRRLSADTGVYQHGDAAFADYLVQFNVTTSF